MKSETFSGTIENAYGQKLDTPIAFEGTYNAFETYQEVVEAGEVPSNDEIVKVVNAKIKANERQKAMQKALDDAGIKKPTLEDPQVQLSTMVKVLRAAGKSEEEATQQARALLGL